MSLGGATIVDGIGENFQKLVQMFVHMTLT